MRAERARIDEYSLGRGSARRGSLAADDVRIWFWSYKVIRGAIHVWCPRCKAGPGSFCTHTGKLDQYQGDFHEARLVVWLRDRRSQPLREADIKREIF